VLLLPKKANLPMLVDEKESPRRKPGRFEKKKERKTIEVVRVGSLLAMQTRPAILEKPKRGTKRMTKKGKEPLAEECGLLKRTRIRLRRQHQNQKK